MIQLVELHTKEQMLPMLPVLQHMYPELSAEAYASLLDEMISKSYRQVAAYEGEELLGVVAYWIIPRLWAGHTLDLDNFVVAPAARSKGVGAMMLKYIEDKAHELGCSRVVLDAYTVNFKAQKFYLMHDYRQLGFHLVKEVK